MIYYPPLVWLGTNKTFRRLWSHRTRASNANKDTKLNLFAVRHAVHGTRSHRWSNAFGKTRLIERATDNVWRKPVSESH